MYLSWFKEERNPVGQGKFADKTSMGQNTKILKRHIFKYMAHIESYSFNKIWLVLKKS
ncbi:MAG: hypothetical protein OXM55_04235 [Bdellovibrionales bacterium]|nr:hypothetical protein [Bdellovibrionales bacterium]